MPLGMLCGSTRELAHLAIANGLFDVLPYRAVTGTKRQESG